MRLDFPTRRYRSRRGGCRPGGRGPACPVDELHGDAGDWRVVDASGDERTVRDVEFRQSHEPLGGELWRRTGTFRAWQASATSSVLPDDGGWGRSLSPGLGRGRRAAGSAEPVTDDQFRSSYTRSTDPAVDI